MINIQLLENFTSELDNEILETVNMYDTQIISILESDNNIITESTQLLIETAQKTLGQKIVDAWNAFKKFIIKICGGLKKRAVEMVSKFKKTPVAKAAESQEKVTFTAYDYMPFSSVPNLLFHSFLNIDNLGLTMTYAAKWKNKDVQERNHQNIDELIKKPETDLIERLRNEVKRDFSRRHNPYKDEINSFDDILDYLRDNFRDGKDKESMTLEISEIVRRRNQIIEQLEKNLKSHIPEIENVIHDYDGMLKEEITKINAEDELSDADKNSAISYYNKTRQYVTTKINLSIRILNFMITMYTEGITVYNNVLFQYHQHGEVKDKASNLSEAYSQMILESFNYGRPRLLDLE